MLRRWVFVAKLPSDHPMANALTDDEEASKQLFERIPDDL
jgi:hypothetical protein